MNIDFKSFLFEERSFFENQETIFFHELLDEASFYITEEVDPETARVLRKDKLVTPQENNPKIAKRDKSNKYKTAILHLLPFRFSGNNTCPFASSIFKITIEDNPQNANLIKNIQNSAGYERHQIGDAVTHSFYAQEKYNPEHFINIDPLSKTKLPLSTGECPEILNLRIPGPSSVRDWANGIFVKVPRHMIDTSELIGGCASVCLNTAGNPQYAKNKYKARHRKTETLYKAPTTFLTKLVFELINLVLKATEAKKKPSMRLNGTSDISWESNDYRFPFDSNQVEELISAIWPKKLPHAVRNVILKKLGMKLVASVNKDASKEIISAFARQLAGKTILEAFPEIQFYDYTKNPGRMIKFLNNDASWPKNYHLTYSLSEHWSSKSMAKRFLKLGGNVAVVFNVSKSSRGEGPLPQTWAGFKVIDADKHDFRFLDEKGVVAGLRAKGDAKYDIDERGRPVDFGFVIQPDDPDLDQSDPAVQRARRDYEKFQLKISMGKIKPAGARMAMQLSIARNLAKKKE